MPTSGEATWPRRSRRSARCAWRAASSGVSSASALYRGPPVASRSRKRCVSSAEEIVFTRKARPRSARLAKYRSSPWNGLIDPILLHAADPIRSAARKMPPPRQRQDRGAALRKKPGSQFVRQHHHWVGDAVEGSVGTRACCIEGRKTDEA